MLETLEKIDTLVIDKTGTLTEGRPKLTECLPVPPFSAEDLLRSGRQRRTEQRTSSGTRHRGRSHGSGHAIPAVEQFDSVTGGGVLGTVDGKSILVGKRSLLAEKHVQGLVRSLKGPTHCSSKAAP